MLTTTIDRSGPFFTKDPTKTFRANVRDMMDALAREGEADVRAQMQSGEGRRREITVGGGRVSAEVQGYTTGIRSGRRWACNMQVHIRNQGLSKARAISLHAAAARIESTDHVFRRTTGRLRSARAVNLAELTKGM